MLNSSFMKTVADNTFVKRLKASTLVRKYQELKRKSGNKILIFLFFVALSALIWFFNALGKEYSTYISFPVRYTNFPPGKILTNNLPKKLWLQVNAKGNTILKYKLRSNINPVVFNVKSFASEQLLENGKQELFVLTSLARERLQAQLNQEIQITDIEPDTLFFELATVDSKKVNVIPDIQVSLEKQYMQKGEVQVQPDSVVITGPSNIIDTMDYVTTESYQFKNVMDTVTRELDLMDVNNVNYAYNQVEVTLFAERFTESEINIPIRMENVPDTIRLKTFPRQVNVTFRVGLSDYDKLSPDMFRAVVEFDSTMITEPPRKLDVQLEKYPNFISSVSHNPATVDYILEK